ncbi:hypothetical protein BH11BAC2_BH11BAC2_18330 [soil metagenome]
MKKRWFPFIVTVVFALNTLIILASRREQVLQTTMVQVPVKDLVDGDLVMRNGRGMISNWFRKMSLKDRSYTHAGLVEIVNGKPFVVHCRQEGQSVGIIRESLKEYISSNNCSSFGVYRFALNENSRMSIHTVLDSDVLNGIKFDDEFRLNNGKQEYCTEYVYNRIQLVSGEQNFLPLSHSGDFVYVAPDNLYLNKNTRQLVQHHY